MTIEELGDACCSGCDDTIAWNPPSTIEHGARVANGGSIRFSRVANQLSDLDRVTENDPGWRKRHRSLLLRCY